MEMSKPRYPVGQSMGGFQGKCHRELERTNAGVKLQQDTALLFLTQA